MADFKLISNHRFLYHSSHKFCNITALKTYILSYIYINRSEIHKWNRSGRLEEPSLRTMCNLSESDMSRILSEAWLVLLEVNSAEKNFIKVKDIKSNFVSPNFDSKDQKRNSCFCTQNSNQGAISWRHLCRKICCRDDGASWLPQNKQQTCSSSSWSNMPVD